MFIISSLVALWEAEVATREKNWYSDGLFSFNTGVWGTLVSLKFWPYKQSNKHRYNGEIFEYCCIRKKLLHMKICEIAIDEINSEKNCFGKQHKNKALVKLSFSWQSCKKSGIDGHFQNLQSPGGEIAKLVSDWGLKPETLARRKSVWALGIL